MTFSDEEENKIKHMFRKQRSVLLWLAWTTQGAEGHIYVLEADGDLYTLLNTADLLIFFFVFCFFFILLKISCEHQHLNEDQIGKRHALIPFIHQILLQ